MHTRQRRTRTLVPIALSAAGTGVAAHATHLLRRNAAAKTLTALSPERSHAHVAAAG